MHFLHSNPQRLAAEFFGTLWLAFGGCGAAVLASENVQWLATLFGEGEPETPLEVATEG